jgi:hypothetical protein
LEKEAPYSEEIKKTIHYEKDRAAYMGERDKGSFFRQVVGGAGVT